MAKQQKTTKKFTTVRRAEYAKAGRRAKPYQRPPAPRAGAMARDARRLRRERANGAFGVAPVHVWNHLVIGTSGRHKQTPKELSAAAKRIREAQKAELTEQEEAS